MITLKFFASVREQVGVSVIEHRLSSEKNVADLMHALIQQGGNWKSLGEQDVLIALNQNLSGKDAAIKDGDEIAFFPPVTGG